MRIGEIFQESKKNGKTGLIGYLPAGYPSTADFPGLVSCLAGAGLQCLEIGIPDKNPQLDGPVISQALNQVLDRGLTFEKAIALAGKALRFTLLAGLGMLYHSTLRSLGLSGILRRFQAHGIKGILVPDPPLLEWNLYTEAASSYGISPIGFIPVAMTEKDIQKVASSAEGFLYLQAYSGSTGEKIEIDEAITARLSLVKKIAAERNLPVAVGFGVRSKEDALKLKNIGVDGIIIGTALVEAASESRKRAVSFIHDISKAVNGGAVKEDEAWNK